MIDLNDLRHAMSRALDLGRYTIVVKTAGGDQVPASITLDLLERDDDLFDTEFSREADARAVRYPTITPEGDALVDTVTDDHGPAVPAQDKVYASPYDPQPRIYEFALQDAVYLAKEARLEHVTVSHAPDMIAVGKADWVHVYDRVTRERRTLKRPTDEKIVKGLADVAADLRRGVRVRHAGPASNGDTGMVLHVESGWAMTQFERSDRPGLSRVDHLEPVDTASAEKPADPMPPVGPLTSTEGLKVGDVLANVDDPSDLYRFVSVRPESEMCFPGELNVTFLAGAEGINTFDSFAFVARPGVWMPWEGGENPVPGMMVRRKNHSGLEVDGVRHADSTAWNGSCHITAYMVVDTPSSSSDT